MPLGPVWALELIEGSRVYFMRITNLPSDVLEIIRSSPTRQKEVVNNSIPPVLTTPNTSCAPNKSANKRRRIGDVLLLLLGLFLGVAFLTLGKSVARFVNLIRPRYDLSTSSDFHVTVLKVQSSTNHFSERIRVDANGPLEVGVYTADVKSPAFREDTTNSNIVYRIRDPMRIGQAWPLGGTDTNRSCEIYILIKTTPSGTVWHSKIRGMQRSIVFGHEMLHESLNTSLPEPMTVSGIETNWPDKYPVGCDIPLGNLGDYKILLTTAKESSGH